MSCSHAVTITFKITKNSQEDDTVVNEMAITTRSADETIRLGVALGELLESGDVVLLTGDLGAGKTTFTKGVGNGLGVTDTITSPTFTLVNQYEGRVPLAHMDLYRLYGETIGTTMTQADDSGEAETHELTPDVIAQIGIEDYLESDFAVLMEWPRGLEGGITDALHIQIQRMPLPRMDERVFHCRSTGSRSWAILDEWVKKWLF